MFTKKIGIAIVILLLSLIILPACNLENNTPPNEINDISNPPPDESDNELETQIQDEEQEYIDVDNNQAVMALTNLNVRSSPTTQDDNRVGLLYQGYTLKLLEQTNSSWYKVDYYGTTAYVSTNSSYTKVIEIDSDNGTTPSQTIDKIIAEGMSVLGTPYEYGSPRILLWGGSDNPNFTGNTFDCSAFVQYAYYVGAGIKLQGDSRSQSREGQLIALDQLQRGDLIFMTTTMRQDWTGLERIGHVAIYLGNDEIIHTFGTGGVRIQQYSGFWENRAIHARRMI